MKRALRPVPTLHDSRHSRPSDEQLEVEERVREQVTEACSRVFDCARLVASALVLARHRLEQGGHAIDEDLRRVLASGEAAARCIPELALELLAALELEREPADTAADAETVRPPRPPTN